MSEYWGYRCETCGVISPHWWNRGDGQLEVIASEWPVWRAALALRNGWIEVTCLGVHDEPTPLTFLQEHDGHTLVLHSEYGTTRPLAPVLDTPRPAP